VFRRNTHRPWQTLDGSTLIIAPRDQESHELTGVGSFIWEKLDGCTPVEEIAQNIQEEWDCEGQTVESDTVEFFKSLLHKKLIEEVERAPSKKNIDTVSEKRDQESMAEESVARENTNQENCHG